MGKVVMPPSNLHPDNKKDNTLEEQEKKADILKKLHEAKETKNSAKLKKIEVIKLYDQSNIDKAKCLNDILSTHVIDEENTVIGSEPMFKIMIDGKLRDEMLNKLSEIVKRF